MNNAEAIYSGIERYADMQNLLGTQENIFLDFKERDPAWKSPGKLSDSEKRLFSKAASGFAHQQGGILIWGIEARQNSAGIDQAQALKPFDEVKQFKHSLERYVQIATDPIVDGIQHRVIFENDTESSNRGFVVSYFPKSDRVHRALGSTTDDFYKRQGDSFVPLSTEDIRSLFFRTLAPNLEFVVTQGEKHVRVQPDSITGMYKFGVRNIGSGIAKYVSLYVGLVEVGGIYNVHIWDEDGNETFKLGRITSAEFGHYGKHFIVNGDIVVYPNQSISLFSFQIRSHGGQQQPRFRFKLFAENMLPKEGESGEKQL